MNMGNRPKKHKEMKREILGFYHMLMNWTFVEDNPSLSLDKRPYYDLEHVVYNSREWAEQLARKLDGWDIDERASLWSYIFKD